MYEFVRIETVSNAFNMSLLLSFYFKISFNEERVLASDLIKLNKTYYSGHTLLFMCVSCVFSLVIIIERFRSFIYMNVYGRF